MVEIKQPMELLIEIRNDIVKTMLTNHLVVKLTKQRLAEIDPTKEPRNHKQTTEKIETIEKLLESQKVQLKLVDEALNSNDQSILSVLG